jgi:phosphate transport system protein
VTTQHIVHSFDKELRKLESNIAVMGGLAETQLADAIEVMLQRDSERAAQVAAQDTRIDALEEQINQQVVRLLALRQPVAVDLRVALAALKISADLERIGDYAKNIAKRTRTLTESASVAQAMTIGRMGRLVQGMIKDVLDAFANRDVAKAEDVRIRDEEVDALHTSLFRELLTYMMEDARAITPCTHLLFVAKNIERIGDHATNIAESVHFMVEGSLPLDERPKHDASSFTTVDADDNEEGGGG